MPFCWKGFEKFLEKAFPFYEISVQQIEMDLNEDDTEGIDSSEE
jgi:hypothetical protein